MKAREEADGQS